MMQTRNRSDLVHRFVDLPGDNHTPSDSLHFFSGENVSNAMSRIRDKIYLIRQNWDVAAKRTEFKKNLLSYLQQNLNENDESRKKIGTWEALVGNNVNWSDVEEMSGSQSSQCSIDFIREFTDSVSFEYVYKKAYKSLRSPDSHDGDILNIVYLVEILNINLYNIVQNDKGLDNFTGTVYRGLLLQSDQVSHYETLLTRPIVERYISVPLGLLPTSLVPPKLTEWIPDDALESGNLRALLTIHVIGLDDEMLAVYRKRFPSSKVSTICAVPIEKFSNFSLEKEVLLRGAFFQLLRAERDPQGLFQIECMMLNSNRDHLSTARLGDDDTPARSMFGLMVQVTRYRFIVDYCRQRCLLGDLALYESALSTAEKKLSEIIKK